MIRFYHIFIINLAIIILVPVTLMAQSPSAYFEYANISSGKDSIRILTPVFEGSWTRKTQCRTATKALTKALKRLDIKEKPILVCNGNLATVKLPGIKKDRIEDVLPIAFYTLRWYGLETISIDGLHPKPISRMEIQAIALCVTMPFWTNLPPAPPIPGLLKTESGKWLDSIKFRKALENKDNNAIQVLKKGLKSSKTKEKLAILVSLPYIKGLNILKMVKPLVRDQSKGVRLAVVKLLQEIRDMQATKLLTTMATDDNSVIIRVQAARILGKRGIHTFDNIAAVDDINSKNPKVAIHAIDILLSKPVQGVGPILLSALGSSSKKVTKKALSALIKLKMTKELVKVLDNTDLPNGMRLQSARYLSVVPDRKARIAGLQYLLKNGNELDKGLACGLAKKFKDKELAPALLSDLANKPGKESQSALYALVSFGESEMIRPMSRLIAGPLAEKAADAVIQLIKTRPLSEILKLATDPDTRIRTLAVRVLGRQLKGQDTIPPKIAKILGKALKSTSNPVKTAAAAALANSNDQRQLKLLCGLSSDQDPKLRTVACIAATKVGGTTGTTILMSGLNDTSDKVRLAAIQGIIKLKIRDAMPVLITLGNYQNLKVRRLAYKAFIGMLKPGETLQYRQFITRGLTDRDKTIRLTCLQALRGIKDRKIVAAIGDMKIDPDKTVRRQAIEVLETAGTPNAVEALEDIATIDADQNIRIAALKALAKTNPPDLVNFLQELLKHEKEQEGNKEIIGTIQDILKSLAL